MYIGYDPDGEVTIETETGSSQQIEPWDTTAGNDIGGGGTITFPPNTFNSTDPNNGQPAYDLNVQSSFSGVDHKNYDLYIDENQPGGGTNGLTHSGTVTEIQYSTSSSYNSKQVLDDNYLNYTLTIQYQEATQTNLYETAADFSDAWSDSGSVTTQWPTLNFQTIGNVETLYDNRPITELTTVESPYQTTQTVNVYQTVLDSETQTINTTVRGTESLGPKAFAAFTGNSIDAQTGVLILANNDVSIQGEVSVSGNTGTVNAVAGNDLTVTGVAATANDTAAQAKVLASGTISLTATNGLLTLDDNSVVGGTTAGSSSNAQTVAIMAGGDVEADGTINVVNTLSIESGQGRDTQWRHQRLDRYRPHGDGQQRAGQLAKRELARGHRPHRFGTDRDRRHGLADGSRRRRQPERWCHCRQHVAGQRPGGAIGQYQHSARQGKRHRLRRHLTDEQFDHDWRSDQPRLAGNGQRRDFDPGCGRRRGFGPGDLGHLDRKQHRDSSHWQR